MARSSPASSTAASRAATPTSARSARPPCSSASRARCYRGFRWHVGAGGITYWPADDEGIFRDGGTTRFLAGAGVDYRRPVLPKWDLMTTLSYDFHRFTTDALDARGFSPDAGREPGVALGRPLPECTMTARFRWVTAGLVVAGAACGDIATPIRNDFYEWRLIVPAASGSGNDSLSFHWPKERLPVRIWVEDAASLPVNVPAAIAAWRRAFLYNEFDATIVGDSATADVIVRAGSAPGVQFSRTRLHSALALECAGATDLDISDDHSELQLPVRVFIDPRSEPNAPNLPGLPGAHHHPRAGPRARHLASIRQRPPISCLPTPRWTHRVIATWRRRRQIYHVAPNVEAVGP